MVEAKNFVEKELGKSLEEEQTTEQTTEQAPEKKEFIPTYTPPPQAKQEPTLPPPQIIQQPVIQIVEKIVYRKQRIHGFFRTLTIIALLAIGFLMLGESTGIVELSVNTFKLHQIFPLVIILGTIIIRSYKGIFGKIFGLIIFLGVWGGLFTISVYTSLNPSSKRKEGETLNYTIPEAKNKTTNFYLQTLVGNSYIEGSGKENKIQGTWNSDRNLLVSSGNNGNVAFLKLQEDNNRNILQDHASNIDVTVPNDTTFDLLYIKNILGLHTIDLNTFQRKMLKFHAGIDDITVKVGNVLSGNKIEIQGTAANVEFDIPRDVGVMMYYKHFIGKLNAPEFDALSGHYYQSQNITAKKAILNIYTNLTIGSAKINRVEPKN